MRAQSSYTNDDELFLSWQHDPLTSSPEESDVMMEWRWRRENEGSRGSA